MVSVVVTLRHHSDELSCCCFSSALLATCSADKTLRLYDAADFSQRPFSPLSGHGYGVHCCCFSSCGRFLLSCSTDGSVIVWGSDTGEVLAVLRHPDRSPLRVCAVSPDSSLLLAGACDGTAAVWDFTSRTLLRYSSTVSTASVVACCFSPCGQFFVSGCTRGDLKVWDAGIRLLHAEKDAHDLGVTCCSAAPQFEVGERREKIKKSCVCSWPSACIMKLLHTLTSHSAPVLSCAFSSDGDIVVSGLPAINTLHRSAPPPPTRRYVTTVALSPTMPWIATGSMDRSVNVWRIGDADILHDTLKLPGHSRLLLADWSEEDVQSWLCEEGLEELVGNCKANNIDGLELSQLNKETAAELGIDGYSYERDSIESWIKGKNKTSPMTNLPLPTTLLTPNRSLKMAITRWKSSQ
uniref:WD repeat, SAM and U-box domain-containing protein 1 n=1 Tax=Echeneis naucrates TaxID=173247 RepID=A0A665UXD7_ECHNA